MVGNEHGNGELLKMTLEAAVPLWIARVRTYSDARRRARQEELADVIAAHGDVILYRSKKRGETADAFNALAEALALMAYAPGGVTFSGLHFTSGESDSPEDRSLSLAPEVPDTLRGDP